MNNYKSYFSKSAFVRRANIQLIMSLAYSLIAIVGMGFVGVALYGRYVETTQNVIIENNMHRIEQASWNLDAYIRNMMGISDTMYYSVIKNKDLSKETMDQEMALLYEANKDDLVSIACFKKDGTLITATPVSSLKQGANPTGQQWFNDANEKIENLHFSTPHVQNLFEDSNYRYYWVVSLSRAVELTDRGSTYRGILLVDMNFSSIERLFNKINSKGSGYVYLTDSEGEIIYHPKQKLIYSGLLNENNLVAAAYEDGEHSEYFEGDQRVVVVKTIGYTGWKIICVTPVSEFSMNMNEMRDFSLIIITFSILIIFVATLIASSRITNPIKRLENSVKLIESGNLNVRVYEGGSNEIRHLGRTINSMVDQVRMLMDEVVKEQEEKRKSELDALQAQINPHFLYNTLDSIIWMIECERFREAIDMVSSLASLFRISLSKGKNIIPISEEIEHAKHYVNIQKVRYKNKFTATFEIDEEVLKYMTNKLVIQPIIENAIYYGIEGMYDEGEIFIRVYRKEEDVYIEVQDNGLGIPPEILPLLLTEENVKVKKRGSGVGMYNVHRRIQVYFGNEYGLEVESELDEGTTVRIHLPAREEGGDGHGKV